MNVSKKQQNVNTLQERVDGKDNARHSIFKPGSVL
jgi:hypothetical protein